MNPFSKVLESAKSMFETTKSVSVVGIDVGSSSIKIVELKRKAGKAVLETYGAIGLGPYAGLALGQVTNLPGEKIAQAIKDLLKEINATTNSGAIAIPSSASLIFTIEIPAQVADKDVRMVVETEARRFIPVPISEVALDSWPIPKEEMFTENDTDPLHPESAEVGENQKTKVLVAAIHKDTITKYQDIVEKSGVDVSFFEIETFSAIRSVLEHEVIPVMIMDCGASKIKLTIVEHGLIRIFHIINRGTQDITQALSKSLSIPFDQAEEMKKKYGLSESVPDPNIHEIIKGAVDYAFSETSSVILDYERKTGRSIKKIFITGGGALLYGIADYAALVFRCEVELGNAFQKAEAPAFLEQMLAVTGPEFAVAVGIALRKLQ